MKMYLNLVKGKLNSKGLLNKGKLQKKKGDDKIIVTIALCVVGALVIVMFKDSLTPIVSTLLQKVNTAITGMFS